MEDIKNIEDKITKNTRLIWIETPTNPMMNIIDIKSLAKLSKKIKFFCVLITHLPLLIFKDH